MKQPGEELREPVTELDDSTVVDYLLHNPEFFYPQCTRRRTDARAASGSRDRVAG